MPRPPNDNERRNPARVRKRKGKASAPSGANVVAFPVGDALQAEADTSPYLPEIQEAIDTAISLTPLQLLAVILKAKLQDRIKDEEVHRICHVYYDALATIWGNEEE